MHYYQLGQSINYDETELNGEMIAINYVFIISVLELVKWCAEEEMAGGQEHKKSFSWNSY